jgi:hypothetical protein
MQPTQVLWLARVLPRRSSSGQQQKQRTMCPTTTWLAHETPIACGLHRLLVTPEHQHPEGITAIPQEHQVQQAISAP